MTISGMGFGHYKWGSFPFGHADYGEDAVIRSFPPSYLLDANGNENVLLKQYLSIVKNTANTQKRAIDKIADQVDPDAVRTDILRFLGETIAVHLDGYEPPSFQRSLVNNATQYYRIKGTANSFRIRGKISGYDVQVINVYRLNRRLPVTEIQNYALDTGNGNPQGQTIAGTMPSRPIIAGSVSIAINGTLAFVDDGTGNIVAGSGTTTPVASHSAIDYDTGIYSFTLTPAPAVASTVTASYSTGIRGFAIGTGDGTASQRFVNTLFYYPPLPGTFRIFAGGTEIAHDDGLGGLVSSQQGTAVSGTIDDLRGVYSLTITPAPALGTKLTANYSKTILADFLAFASDQIFEIPTGSDRWYVTSDPGTLPGGPTEASCDYCLTSFIKVLFTLVRPLGIAIPSSTENFFDRLVRKLRDITPIHVRDILYELRFNVLCDENQYLSAAQESLDETTWMPVAVQHFFDVVSLDCVPLDSSGYIQGTVSLE